VVAFVLLDLYLKLYVSGKGSFVSLIVFFNYLRLVKSFHSCSIAWTHFTIFLCNCWLFIVYFLYY